MTHPPNRSAVSLCWFMLITLKWCPWNRNRKHHQPVGFFCLLVVFLNHLHIEVTVFTLYLPVIWARYWTVEVLPVPVSPTKSTGSPLTTHTASCSINTADGRVAAKVCFALKKTDKIIIIKKNKQRKQLKLKIYQGAYLNFTFIIFLEEWLDLGFFF